MESGDLRFPVAKFGDVSEEAKGFVRGLLSMDSGGSIRSADEALRHPWLSVLNRSTKCLQTATVLQQTSRAQVMEDFEQMTHPEKELVTIPQGEPYQGTTLPQGREIKVVSKRPSSAVFDPVAAQRKMQERQRQVIAGQNRKQLECNPSS